MAVFDSTTLLYLLEPNAKAPEDTQIEEPIVDAQSRMEALVKSLEARQEAVLVPTPVLSEVLVHADNAGPSYLEILGKTSRFRIAPFDEKAAIELAEMTRRAYAKGDLRAGTDATRARLKFDRQILAIARVQSENHVYTDDRNMRTFAKAEGFRVTRLQDIPLPLSTRQTALPFSDNDPTTELDSGE